MLKLKLAVEIVCSMKKAHGYGSVNGFTVVCNSCDLELVFALVIAQCDSSCFQMIRNDPIYDRYTIDRVIIVII